MEKKKIEKRNLREEIEFFGNIIMKVAGFLLLCWMLYVQAYVTPFDKWLFIFPAVIMKLEFKEIIKTFFK